MWYVTAQLEARARLSVHSSVFRSFRSVALQQKCKYFSPIRCRYSVTAREKWAETARLTKMCPGSIISALRDIKHNITLSGYTLCSYSAQKTATQRRPKTAPRHKRRITTTAPLLTSHKTSNKWTFGIRFILLYIYDTIYWWELTLLRPICGSLTEISPYSIFILYSA